MGKLRRDAVKEKYGSYRQMQMLAQALAPCVSMDAFLPKGKAPEMTDTDHLCKLPVLICTADERTKTETQTQA